MHPNAEALATNLKNWFRSLRTSGVKMIENPIPTNEKYGDYRVDHEIIFEPISLAKCRLEIWMESNGYFGLGVDGWDRIAKQQCLKSSPKRFVAGFEPSETDEDKVMAICRAAAEGRICAEVEIFVSAIAATAAVLKEDDQIIRWPGPQRIPRLFFFTPLPGYEKRLIKYERWDQ
jgi:hypothetical protein